MEHVPFSSSVPPYIGVLKQEFMLLLRQCNKIIVFIMIYICHSAAGTFVGTELQNEKLHCQRQVIIQVEPSVSGK